MSQLGGLTIFFLSSYYLVAHVDEFTVTIWNAVTKQLTSVCRDIASASFFFFALKWFNLSVLNTQIVVYARICHVDPVATCQMLAVAVLFFLLIKIHLLCQWIY
jgi:hypothetical protein